MRRWFVPTLKLCISLGLVCYVLASGLLDFSRLKRLALSPTYFFLALGALSAQLWFSALRLKQLLRAHGKAPAFWVVLKLTYLGAFFDSVSITSVGGDPIKAWYLAREVPIGRRTEAVSALVVDRLLGLLGLLGLTAFATACFFKVLWNDLSFRPYLLGLLAVCASLSIGTFLLFSRRLHEWGPLRWMMRKLPFGALAERAYSSMQRFRDRPAILLEGWALSNCVHVFSSLAGYLLAQGLELRVSDCGAGLFFAALLMANFVCSFASFGAIGVGQAAFAFVFMRVAGLSGGADLATASQIAFFLIKTPGIFAWIAARKPV